MAAIQTLEKTRTRVESGWPPHEPAPESRWLPVSIDACMRALVDHMAAELTGEFPAWTFERTAGGLWTARRPGYAPVTAFGPGALRVELQRLGSTPAGRR